MTKVETDGYMGSYKTKSFQRVSEEFVNTILKSYCNKDKTICSLGAYNDILADQIEYKNLTLVDQKFGELKYRNYGIYITKNRIYTCKADPKLFKHICYIECDILKYLGYNFIPRYDVVIMTNVAEHIEYWEFLKIMSKIKNILKPDGYFIITFPNFRSVNRLVGTELGIIDDPEDFDKHDKKLGHVEATTTWYMHGHIPTHSKLKLVQEIGIYFKPLSHAQMDKYFGDCLDRFIDIGYDLGPEACSYIGAVFKNE